ncbi:MAG: hypothetical protein IH947_13160 [Bacteroidetes bacterium]|nr:hypothetical protein [Bacteroidota bacterium]
MMLIKYARWVVHGQGGHIEGLRVGWPSKMSLLVVLPMFTELLRHFCAGWLVRLAGKCVFSRSLSGVVPFSPKRDAFGILLRFLLSKQKKMKVNLKYSNVSKFGSF